MAYFEHFENRSISTSSKLLLTGAPGCGKTTLVQNLLADLNRPAGGFTTHEIRQSGIRRGFEIVTLSGEHGVLADVDLHGPLRIGRYGVSCESVERLAVPAVLRAWQDGLLVVIDEIGPMEMFSRLFCQAIEQILSSPADVLGTIVLRSTPFGDRVKRMTGVELIEVTRGNRGPLKNTLARRFSEW